MNFFKEGWPKPKREGRAKTSVKREVKHLRHSGQIIWKEHWKLIRQAVQIRKIKEVMPLWVTMLPHTT
jgi:hypothetical protein